MFKLIAGSERSSSTLSPYSQKLASKYALASSRSPVRIQLSNEVTTGAPARREEGETSLQALGSFTQRSQQSYTELLANFREAQRMLAVLFAEQRALCQKFAAVGETVVGKRVVDLPAEDDRLFSQLPQLLDQIARAVGEKKAEQDARLDGLLDRLARVRGVLKISESGADSSTPRAVNDADSVDLEQKAIKEIKTVLKKHIADRGVIIDQLRCECARVCEDLIVSQRDVRTLTQENDELRRRVAELVQQTTSLDRVLREGAESIRTFGCLPHLPHSPQSPL